MSSREYAQLHTLTAIITVLDDNTGETVTQRRMPDDVSLRITPIDAPTIAISRRFVRVILPAKRWRDDVGAWEHGWWFVTFRHDGEVLSEGFVNDEDELEGDYERIVFC